MDPSTPSSAHHRQQSPHDTHGHGCPQEGVPKQATVPELQGLELVTPGGSVGLHLCQPGNGLIDTGHVGSRLPTQPPHLSHKVHHACLVLPSPFSGKLQSNLPGTSASKRLPSATGGGFEFEWHNYNAIGRYAAYARLQ